VTKRPKDEDRHAQSLSLAEAFAALDVQLGSGNDNGEPIGEPAPVFLYACGWRAGSTLLQRLIVSSQQVLMWGEPYALCGLVQMLTGASRPLLKGYPESFYPEPSELTEAAQVEIRDKLTSSWIANVHPHPKRFKRALRALFDELYGAQAKAAGYPRFGVKEVRLGAPQAVFLKWLYPQSKAIFLVRDPRDCWRSAKAIAENKVWDLPFGPPVTDAQSYARLWREVADSFMHHGETSDLLFLRYEDLTGANGANEVALIEQHLGIETDHSVFEHRVRGFESPPQDLTAEEIETFRSTCGPLLTHFGYDSTS